MGVAVSREELARVNRGWYEDIFGRCLLLDRLGIRLVFLALFHCGVCVAMIRCYLICRVLEGLFWLSWRWSTILTIMYLTHFIARELRRAGKTR